MTAQSFRTTAAAAAACAPLAARCRSGTRQQRRQWRRPTAASASSGGPSAGDAGQTAGSASGSVNGGSGSPSSSSTSAFSRSPWELMGRVMNEQRIALQFDKQLNQGLIRSAAARESGLEFEEFEERLQRLLALMPFLQERLVRMSPKLLAALAADPSLVAGRLIELKSLLPGANVAAIAGARPSLLLLPEWERVPAAVAALARHYSEEEVARLAAAEPLLLAEDVEQVLAELQRLLPAQSPVAALLHQPSLASSVSRLSHLSLWLAGAGGDARSMLLRDPSLVYSVQRGTRSLGPGAEFL